MCSICVSCHWGNCHAKTLDNSHDKQKYFDNSQSLDAAEEEPSETGTEEDPVLSVENSGRDSDVLRLESKLIWPELCFWSKINSQTWSLGFLYSQAFVLSFNSHLLYCRSWRWPSRLGGRRQAIKWKCSAHFFLFSPPQHLHLLEQIWFMYESFFLMSLVYWVSHWKKKQVVFILTQ